MNVVITGASRGIGFEVVKKFLEKEAHQIVALSLELGRLSELNAATQLQSHEFNVATFTSEELLEHTAHLDTIDILINNAGTLVNKDFLKITDQEWQRSMDVNVLGPARIIKTLFPQFKKSDRAHIVNISSMGGFQGSMKFAGLTAYSASKAALANLTESLAVEFQATNIAVNCLCPGAVNTEMFQEAFPQFTAPLESEAMATYIHDFALTGHRFFNGKILPVSTTTP